VAFEAPPTDVDSRPPQVAREAVPHGFVGRSLSHDDEDDEKDEKDPTQPW